MRAVADTNVVVSGLLWQGAPRQLLLRARTGQLALFTSAEMLDELEEVLERKKFSSRLKLAEVSPRELVLGYAALANVVRSAPVQGVVVADPDDDLVVACAVSAQADLIVSGDSHLLELKSFQGIRVLSAGEALLEL